MIVSHNQIAEKIVAQEALKKRQLAVPFVAFQIETLLVRWAHRQGKHRYLSGAESLLFRQGENLEKVPAHFPRNRNESDL